MYYQNSCCIFEKGWPSWFSHCTTLFPLTLLSSRSANTKCKTSANNLSRKKRLTNEISNNKKKEKNWIEELMFNTIQNTHIICGVTYLIVARKVIFCLVLSHYIWYWFLIIPIFTPCQFVLKKYHIYKRERERIIFGYFYFL